MLTRSLVTLAALCCLSSLRADEPTITGSFKGEGKDAKLISLLIKEGKDDRKGRLILIFSDKKLTGKETDLDAMFGRLGNCLVITMKPDGTITNCLVAHTAHGEQGFQSIGEIELKGMKKDGGKLSGHLTTNGPQKAFGKSWEVDLKFSVKLP
jgi:hypothetical protein